MSRSDHEDDWIGEVQHREGFVLDEQSMSAMEIPDREVTYRRANVETQFMTSRFDSQTEDVFAPPPPGKVMFTTSPATLQDLEDGSSTVLGLEPKPNDFGLGAASTGEESTKSQVFVPIGEVPDAREVGYRQVNPMFESCEPADVIFRTLHKAMRAQDVEFSCSHDWTMDAYTLIAAEELFFNVQLHRLAIKSTIRVDFNLRSGDELKFLGLTDSIRKECRAIDKDMIGLPELSFDILADWSAPGELFPGSLSVDSQELSMLLLEINSESPPFTRYEVAKRLKELCQYDSNRRALADLLKEQFVTGLQSMLKDDNEDIVRFAIYTILNFADDISTLNDLELPRLPETLRDILMLSQKESTKKLAGDLYKTINAVC
ncbi:hypothetical protein PC129_g19220 [Phytophthora cactorum]|uniref:Armadillo-type fold n=1 Tax=Phytophthora cactorum TaxID=29920 RepID=A0A329SPK1_9STRA|nr:hypothetical protein Pcac1_g3566 [Phytophthora cactorum]KAG2830908.1 hypothetical protein PC112_g7507 [Phytophthora cactorum]KAG2861076.1 hypothetical protein PC113_g7504 [Phytophthora cactorum]KAG2899956.1 hypothetical protein PC117_g22102 [Phytophthora cactorum]KAG3018758.1 hypothetical protein PC119_g10551 [Phytophthora cactorum]